MTRVHLSLVGLVLLASVALAQTPSRTSPADLYHRGARAFVDGENAAALAAVETGLAQAPDDARLRALRDLIQQQQDEQDKQDGGQEGDAENADPGDQGPQGDQGEDDADEGEGGDQDQPSQGPPPADDPEAKRDQTSTAPPQSAASGEAPPSMGEPGEMTKAQADRILDAVGGEERLLLREMRRAPNQRRRSDKDW